jgi:tungstate transport system substrate-binding protein
MKRLLVAAVFLAACSGDWRCSVQTPTASPTAAPQGSVLVGTTTTTQDTGLLDVLIPDFERRTGWKVKLVVGGSGQILTQAARGDLDVILTHSPTDEEAFVKAGNATDRRLVMHNDFVILGPTADPTGIRGQRISDALRRIYDVGAPFISRGDKSGTNVKELALWQDAGRDPKGKPWYVESGVGQLQNLQLAVTRRAYTLSDRGTWIANQKQLTGLAILVQGGPTLLNVYHVTVLDPARFPRVELRGARAFADYLVGRDGQAVIAAYGVQPYGQATFTADAGKNEADLE